jgi:hypothetical protein|tara:strand:+ start:674 stop:871 length:198 start_codon:yes stop_codon:yes gene_type:complete
MLYLILSITIINTALIVFLYRKQAEDNKSILDLLNNKESLSEEMSEGNKQHIDDMLKMREMYESD